MDRHRFDVNPDPNSHVNADPGPDPDQDWHQNGPRADPTPSFAHVEKSEVIF